AGAQMPERVGRVARSGVGEAGHGRSSPERGGGPCEAWWRGPTFDAAERWAPSTTPLRVAVPLPVPGRSLAAQRTFDLFHGCPPRPGFLGALFHVAGAGGHSGVAL